MSARGDGSESYSGRPVWAPGIRGRRSLNELEDLLRARRQVVLRSIESLHQLPMFVGNELPLDISPALADQHEGDRKTASIDSAIANQLNGRLRLERVPRR